MKKGKYFFQKVTMFPYFDLIKVDLILSNDLNQVNKYLYENYKPIDLLIEINPYQTLIKENTIICVFDPQGFEYSSIVRESVYIVENIFISIGKEKNEQDELFACMVEYFFVQIVRFARKSKIKIIE